MRQHLRFCLLLSIVLFVGCAEDSAVEPVGVSEEPPFYVADENADGPLTLAELDINIPREIDAGLTDGEKACFFAAVEKRAAEAGDPAALDPDDFPYWGGKTTQDEWEKFSPYMQRVLLGQAVVSWAMVDCQ